MIALPRPTSTVKDNGPLECPAGVADPSYFCMEWNAENQLKRVTRNSVEQARFKYDAVGRRVEKVASGVTTTWAYDGDGILRQVAGGTTAKYVHGPGIDEPVASDDGTTLGSVHADGLGSIVKTANSAAAITLTRQYDAWGILQAGTTSTGFAFTGREWDPETGLHYYRARYYDPRPGRFISEDPIGLAGGMNYYAYANGAPTTNVDPTGLFVPSVHNEITTAAIRIAGSPCSDLPARVAQADFAPGSQKPANAPWHAMRDGTNPKATADSARRDYNNFVGEQISTCSCEGLARAMHATQDSYASGHANFQSWGGGVPSFSHVYADSYPSRTVRDGAIQASVDLIRRYSECNTCPVK